MLTEVLTQLGQRRNLALTTLDFLDDFPKGTFYVLGLQISKFSRKGKVSPYILSLQISKLSINDGGPSYILPPNFKNFHK